MSLIIKEQLELPSKDRLLLVRCELARDSEQSGEYEKACAILSPRWVGIGHDPEVEGLEPSVAAELLLRAGVLTGYVGSSRKLPEAQERAKDLIFKSRSMFADLGDDVKVAEAQIELATCYRREGAYDEARATLRSALEYVKDHQTDIRAFGLLRLATVEASSGKPLDALSLLTEHYRLFEACTEDSIKGKFHNELGATLFHLGEKTGINDYFVRAVGEFTAARVFFQLAGHVAYSASADNNAAMCLIQLNQHDEANQRLDRARSVVTEMPRYYANMEETRARALMAQGNAVEAERVILSNIKQLYLSDEKGLYVESLLTYSAILSELKRTDEASSNLRYAIQEAERIGDLVRAEQATKMLREIASETQLPCKVIQFPSGKERTASTFSYRIKDDSLKNIKIFSGDAIIFANRTDWAEGDLVAVETPDGTFCKLIYFETDDVVRLEGAHENCRARHYQINQIDVIGIAKP